MLTPSRQERLAEFYRRLKAAPAATTHDEMYRQLCDILNEVEDELTDAPFDPNNWRKDGRMYPPQRDNVHSVPDRPGLTRYRTRAHNVFIAGNGAIEIQTLDGSVVLSKPGADGRPAWD